MSQGEPSTLPANVEFNLAMRDAELAKCHLVRVLTHPCRIIFAETLMAALESYIEARIKAHFIGAPHSG